MNINILTAPIQAYETEWRVQSQTKTGKLVVVPYITNRCVMDRFDQAFGWDKWNSKFAEIAGGFLCTLTVTLPDGSQVFKTDTAERTEIEPLKGGVSGAMKRAAVQFGLGRDLYNYPRVFIENKEKYIPNWAYAQLTGLVSHIQAGKVDADMVTLREGSNPFPFIKPAPHPETPMDHLHLQSTLMPRQPTDIEAQVDTAISSLPQCLTKANLTNLVDSLDRSVLMKARWKNAAQVRFNQIDKDLNELITGLLDCHTVEDLSKLKQSNTSTAEEPEFKVAAMQRYRLLTQPVTNEQEELMPTQEADNNEA